MAIIAPNDYPDFLKWLPGEETVIKYESQQDHSKTLIDNGDLLFTLDFNAFHRAGNGLAELMEASKATKVMIDHHQQPDDYAKYIYSDVSMSSTC